MCGYVDLEQGSKAAEGMRQLNFEYLIPEFSGNRTEQYYPAFGGDASRQIAVVINHYGLLKKVYATWWFDCALENQQLIVGPRTSFNARNLSSPFWQHALKYQRGVVFATGLGESKVVGKSKHQFYFHSDGLFALGALFRRFANGSYSAAVITRDAHAEFNDYHDKAFPLFLPMQRDYLLDWLDPNVQHPERFMDLLEHPRLFQPLQVQRVRTFKHRQPMPSFQTQLILPDA